MDNPQNQEVKKQKYPGMGAAGTSMMIRNMPFICFLTFLGIIYIANAHYAEKKVRDIQTLQAELKEIRWEYMSLKSEVMYQGKQLRIAEKVKNLGIVELKEKPFKIKVSNYSFE